MPRKVDHLRVAPDSGGVDYLKVVPDPVRTPVQTPEKPPKPENRSPEYIVRVRRLYILACGLLTLVSGHAISSAFFGFDVDKKVKAALGNFAGDVMASSEDSQTAEDVNQVSVPNTQPANVEDVIDYVQRFCAVYKIGDGFSAVCDGVTEEAPALAFVEGGRSKKLFPSYLFAEITSVKEGVKAVCPVEFPSDSGEGLVFESNTYCASVPNTAK